VLLESVAWSANDFRCFGQGVTALDVSELEMLTQLLCYTNQLTALDVSNNTALTILSCRQNQLTALDVSNNTALTQLLCYTNQLTALDVSNNTALTLLWCNINQLTQASLDGILADLDSHGQSNGELQCHNQTNAGGAAVISTGTAAATSAQNLINKGWTLTYSGTFVPA
jgi:Leucine-rich repeat (LRR) protein